MKIYFLVCYLTLILMGGCNIVGQKEISGIDPTKLPDVVAFQDDFTREFMASTEEVEEGYYLFKSKTGGYTMMYPENARINDVLYEMPGESYEFIQYAENVKELGYQYFARVTYNAGSRANSSEQLKKILSTYANYYGEYEPFEYDDKIVYFAKTENVNEKSDMYSYLAVIISKGSKQAVSIGYNIITNQNNENIDIENVQQDVIKIIESVKFSSNN